MKTKIFFYLFYLAFILHLLASKLQKGGVIISFDDNYIDEWFELREVFNQYQIKATFFIAHSYLLDTDDIQKLKILEKKDMKSDVMDIAIELYGLR